MLKNRFSFNNIKHSQWLIDWSTSHLADKINKFVSKPIDVHVTFSRISQKKVCCRCLLSGGDGFNIEASAERYYLPEHAKKGKLPSSWDISRDALILAFEDMLHKLERQLRDHKEKIKRHKFSEEESIKHLNLIEPIATQDEDWNCGEVDAGEYIVKFQKALSQRKKAG